MKKKTKKEKKQVKKIFHLALSTEIFNPMFFRPKDFKKQFNKLKGCTFIGVKVVEIGTFGYGLDFIFRN